jgi:hypothetical protein
VSEALHRCLSPDPALRPTAAELRAVLSGRGAARDATKTAAAGATTGAGTAKPAARKAPSTRAPARPTARPTARATDDVRTAPGARATAAAPAKGSHLTADRIRLVGEGGRALEIGVRTELGKHLALQFGADAEFWDTRQVILERLPDRRWQAVPVPGTANETLLNGEILVGPKPVKDGDVLAVGRKAKGISKLPLTIRAP